MLAREAAARGRPEADYEEDEDEEDEDAARSYYYSIPPEAKNRLQQVLEHRGLFTETSVQTSVRFKTNVSVQTSVRFKTNVAHTTLARFCYYCYSAGG